MARDERDEELISTGRDKWRARDEKRRRKKDIKAEDKKRQKEDKLREKQEKKGKPSKKRAVHVEFAEKKNEQNGYYIEIAEGYRYTRYAAFVVLVAFILVMLIFFRESITYSNLMYLIRDLNSDTAVAVGVYSDISYEEQYNIRFDTFKGRIATASPTGFNLYSSTGSSELAESYSYSDPRLEVGDKYALVYDAKGKGYSLYTTVSRVFTGKSEKNIDDACVSSEGSYAILTRSDNSKFMITVYDRSFRAINKYYKDKYVMDIALSPNGRELASASAIANGSRFDCEVMCGEVGTEESVSVEIKDNMPIWTGYTENGTLLVLCDSSLSAVGEGKILWQYSFEGDAPVTFDKRGDMFALCLSKNAIGSENELLVFDTKGDIVYNKKISKRVVHFATDGLDTVYAVGEGSATKTVISTDKSEDCPIEGKVLDILCPPGNMIVCTPGGTKSYFAGESK